MRLRGSVNSFLPAGVAVALVATLAIAATPTSAAGPISLSANLVLVSLLTSAIRRTARLPQLPKATARFWNSLARALVVYGVGMAVDLTAVLVQLITGSPVGPLGTQLVFPVAGIFTLYAVFQYPTTARTRGEKITVTLDAGIVLLGGASFIWYFIVSRQWEPGQDWLGLSETLALPAMLLVAGFAMLKIAFVGAGVLHRLPLACYGGSVGCSAMATALPYVPVTTPALLMLAQLFSLTGGVLQYRASAGGDTRGIVIAARRPFSMLPYAASAAAIILLIVVLQPALGWRQWGVMGGVGLLLCFVTVRQLVALRDNARLLDDNRLLNERLHQQAWYDELTGLANRALYRERIGQALERFRTDNVDVALLLIDLDDFKIVNDTLGHDAGDALLREIAGRLQAETRDQDTVCRLGGDEFVIILENADEPHVADLAERLVRSVAAPVRLQGRTVNVGASIGVAFAGASPDDPTELFRQADVAMYSAKTSGKGGWHRTTTDNSPPRKPMAAVGPAAKPG